MCAFSHERASATTSHGLYHPLSPLDPSPPAPLRTPAFIIPPNNTHTHSSTSHSPSHFEVLHTHRTETRRRGSLNFHSSLLGAPEEFIKASAGVCAPTEVYCSRCSVRDGVCISRVAGGRWSKAGDEWEEQESGGVRLGQAMGNSVASHLLEGQHAHTHSHLHTYNQITMLFVQHKCAHTLSRTHMQINMHKC